MVLLGKYKSFFTSIILVLLTINLNNAEPDFEDLRLIKEFAKTWDFNKNVTIKSSLLRDNPKKYDTIRYANDGSSCQQPGYTGQYCEFPICQSSNYEHFDNEVVSVLVDFIHQPSCNKSAPLFVDISMFSFTIEIHGPSNNQPIISVYDRNGTLINPFSADTTDPTKNIYTYSTQNPGVYQIVPSTNTPELGCFIYVASIAQSHIDVGFVPSTQYDSIPPERNDFPVRNPYLNQLNTIVAHTTNVRQPGAITALSIFENYNIMSRPQKFSIRYGCEYDYYYNSLFCHNEDYYFMKVEGYDFFGNSFSRIKSFSCRGNPNPPTAPPPTTTQNPINPTQCQNNGTLVKNSDGSSYCFCKNLFTSYDCSKRICLNNAQPLDDGSCLCTEGFTGDHCQDVKCSAEPGVLPPQHEHKPIFVIRLRGKMTVYIKQLVDQIKALSYDLLSVQDHWFQNFGVITFNNNGATYDSQSFTSVEDFTQYLMNISNNNDASGDCNDQVFSSIVSAINAFQPGSRSPIYVLTDAVPNDPQYFDDLSLLNSYYQSPIYTFLFEDPSCSAWDIYSNEWKLMQQTSERFSGNVFQVYNREQDKFGSIFYNHMTNTYFKSELMYGNDLNVCSNLDRYNSLAVDSGFDALSVVATGTDIDLQLTAPDGTPVLVNPAVQTTSISIWRYNGLQSGQWQFHIIPHLATTSCSIRVYSVINVPGHTFTPYYRLNWAFSDQINSDALFWQPLAKQGSSFVAHLDNYGLNDPMKVNAELVVYSKTDSNRSMTSASNGLWRDGCTFQMYFAPLRCYNIGETLYFTLFVSDPNGFNIQRAGSMFCSDFYPSQLPPGSCQNSGFLLNGTCVCPPQYTGTFCETPICQNGGTVVSDRCSCPPLVSGMFCEFIMCPNQPITPEPLRKKQSITFLLDVTYTNRFFLQQLATYSDVMIRDIISHDRAIVDYIYVVTFDDSETPMILGMTDTNNLGYVRQFFVDAYQKSMGARKDCVTAKVWQALNLARMLNDPHSKLFLFQSSIPDEETEIALEFYTNVYDRFIENRLTLSTYIGATGQQEYYCAGGKYSFTLIETLTKSTYQGEYLEISYSAFMNVPKVVPSFVNSGIAYKKTFTDCMGNCSIYFSVDSHTQNIKAVVKGSTGGFDVTFIMPNQSVDTTSYGLIQDSTTGYWVMETRKECEDGWQTLGPQYCIKLTSQAASWYDAYNDCLKSNAFLVDDLYASKDNYLTAYLGDYNISSIWLGLTDDPNYTEDGTWTWDHGFLGANIPLSSTHYTNWSPNVNLNDPNKQCAYKTRTWDTDNCFNMRAYICQKHSYRDNFSPSISESEKLPPGKWNIKLTSTGKTTIEVRVQSRIRVLSGFLSDIHGDTIDFNANILSSTQRMATHVSGYGDNIFNTYMVNSRMFLLNNTMFEAVNYQTRLSCTYQYLSQVFSCPKNGLTSTDFYALTTGVDELGYTIQRYTAHRCVKEIKKCNHGVAYNDLCICEDSWSGTLCDTPICQNNGTYNSLTKTCTCPIGYSGAACDKAMCFDRSPIQISRDGKIFALVIENTQENLIAINSLKKNISDTLRGLNPKWFDQYIYVTFDSTNQAILKNFFDLSQFLASIQTIVPQDDTTSCNLPVFNAIIKAFGQLNHQQSVVYTITRALPSDLYNQYEFEEAFVQKGPQFYYHTVSGDSGCTTDMSDKVVSLLQQYTIGSGGNFLTTTGQDIGRAFSVIIPSLYHGSVLGHPTFMNNSCSGGITTYVYISRNMSDMYFYIYGQYPTITVISPTNETLQPRTVFSGQAGISPRLYIYQIPVLTDYGIYTVTITSSGNCYAQIRNTGGPEIYYGFVPSSIDKLDIGNHLDNATVAPMNDYNHFVGSVVGDIAALEYVQMCNFYSNECQYLRFYRRNNCTYQYYSDPFKCESGLLYLKVYARDNSGFTIVRDSITQCTQYITTPTYQPTTTTMGPGIITTTTGGVITTTTTPGGMVTTTTTPGGVITTTTPPSVFAAKADIYLITDVSASVPASTYANTLTNFLMQLFNNFNINPSYVNVAFSPSPGDNNVWFTIPVFNAFYGSTSLQNSINSSYYPIDGVQSPGQKQLSEIIELALNPNFISTGYNPSYKPHWLIYVTTTSSPDSNTIAAAQKVRDNGVFKIVTIAYQPTGNIEALLSMSDCFYPAYQPQDLLGLATALAAKIDYDNSIGQDGPC